MQRCADCRFVYDEGDTDEGEPCLRCGYPLPSWVSLPVRDYGSWVLPDDGTKCCVFEQKKQ